jgi:hypothetical protein
LKVRVSRFLVVLSGAIVFFGLVSGAGWWFGSGYWIGCILAAVLCAFSGALWLCCLLRAKGVSARSFADVVSGGIWVRLRVTVVGAAVAGFVIEEGLIWFFGWTVFFYMVVLAAETALAVWLFKEYDRKRDIVKNDGSKFYPGASLAS